MASFKDSKVKYFSSKLNNKLGVILFNEVSQQENSANTKLGTLIL